MSYPYGLRKARGFLTVSTENGQQAAEGESVQTVKADEVTIRLTNPCLRAGPAERPDT